MKTKEIDCWIQRSPPMDDFGNRMVSVLLERPERVANDMELIKGKIVYEEPEPRIEVTPSQIRETLRKCKARLSISERQSITDQMIKELFGEDA